MVDGESLGDASVNAGSEGEGWRELTIPIPELVGRIPAWLIASAVIVAGPFWLVHGLPDFLKWPSATALGGLSVRIALLLLAYVISVPIHEGFHALGMVATGSRWSDITFGSKLRQGIVYVHCAAPMALSAYRITLLLPVVFTGFVPAVWGLATGNGWIVAYAYLMVISAIGDLEMMRVLRPFAGSALVRDHPSLLGCEIKIGPSGDVEQA